MYKNVSCAGNGQMMENSIVPSRVVGSEIHGFHTMADLDVSNMMEEAKGRWLRPNEIHAVLCNHKYFTVYVKPVNLPKNGQIVLFDRKKLRNFRKDGHNWKKKKDGKTVKEAHEHLKVGNEERIHVYYAHGQDNPTFVRRCYWLLDKSLEHIVLVHYRETQELQCSPTTPVNSNSSSALSEPSTSWPLSDEPDSVLDRPYMSLLGRRNSITKIHQQRLHEINTLEWDELLVPNDSRKLVPGEGNTSGYELSDQYGMSSYRLYGDESSNNVYPETSSSDLSEIAVKSHMINYDSDNTSRQMLERHTILDSQAINFGQFPSGAGNSNDNVGKDCLEANDSFGRWMTYIRTDFPESAEGQSLESSISSEIQSISPLVDARPSAQVQMFNITDVSPAWALSTEETKILVVGFFSGQLPHVESKLFLACGDSFIPVEVIQVGVFRCLVPSQTPGHVSLYLTFDGRNPISQVLSYEFRAPVVSHSMVPLENNSNWEEFKLQTRLAHLLFSSNSLRKFSTKLAQNAVKEAKAFAQKTSHISDGWINLINLVESTKLSFPQAKEKFFELILQNRLQEWLLEQVVAGCKITERDEQGQGVIHLCAILGYTWAVYPYSCSGLSLDYRDKYGWTALHWAAYSGREKMVATLLSGGAKPNLVTDPTSENPGGCTAADLASLNSYDGLSAYLAEKALVEQFNDMTLAGNVSGSLQTTGNDTVNLQNLSEDELYLKDTLAAYRTAADAAARIQSAFREHSLKALTEAVESSSSENDARNIVAALKIQHAFRNFDSRKKMTAAVRIQHRFRTWKMRKDFLNMRRQAIKIQSVFRGFQVRRHYRKIVWSVGIFEKAVLRWRLKRKGFRGLKVEPNKEINNEERSVVEEDFFVASRKQAEERVERSVVRVQAMFRSRQAQEEYRRMKMEHNKATLEYGLAHADFDMA